MAKNLEIKTTLIFLVSGKLFQLDLLPLECLLLCLAPGGCLSVFPWVVRTTCNKSDNSCVVKQPLTAGKGGGVLLCLFVSLALLSLSCNWFLLVGIPGTANSEPEQEDGLTD